MKFLVIDVGGIHVATAKRIALDGNEVAYYCPWHSAYPKFEDYAPGYGVPEIKKVKDFGPFLDKADAIMFPDVGMGGLAHTLREKGYPVFGAGRGEVLEQDRQAANEIMDRIGIKHPESWFVKGIDGALEKLKELLNIKTETNQSAPGNYYVKFNMFRGSGESFPVRDIDEAHFMFDGIRSHLGPYSEEVPICIQKSVEGVECGADLFVSDNGWLMPTMVGFESGGSYVGYITDEMGIYQQDLTKLETYLKEIKYRGYYSFECIYDGRDCYFIDHTCRAPYPLGLIFSQFAGDFGKLVYEIATGKATDSRLPKGKFLGCMDVASEEAIKRWLPMSGGDQTMFCRYAMVNDKAYAIPGISLVAAVMGSGDTPDEVQANIAKEADDLSIYFGAFNTKFVNDIRSKYVAPLFKMGVKSVDVFNKGVKSKTEGVTRIKESRFPKAPKTPKSPLSFVESLVRDMPSLPSTSMPSIKSKSELVDVAKSKSSNQFEQALISNTVRIMEVMK